MEKHARIYVAGDRGLVGSALLRNLRGKGYAQIITRTHAELDLTDQSSVDAFFSDERPEYIFLAAAKVGGIYANNAYPAEFIRDNLAIQTNVIHAAWKHGVKRLLFLGSSCIYPRHAPQPMKEECLLSGPLEPTNRPYALAKIAGIEMCWSYNRQYGTQYLAVMPTNLYGPGDNYHPENSHVIPALVRRFHEAKVTSAPSVTVWGTGTPRREFMFSDDMADACVHVMNLADTEFSALLGSDEATSGAFMPPLVNIGVGEDLTIHDLVCIIKEVTEYSGEVIFDHTKPDGAPRKLLDVSRVHALNWHSSTKFTDGLRLAYADYVNQQQRS